MSLPIAGENIESLHLIGIVFNRPIGGDVLFRELHVSFDIARFILSAAEKKLGLFGPDARDVMPEVAKDLDGFQPAIAYFGGRNIDIGEASKAEAAHQHDSGHK